MREEMREKGKEVDVSAVPGVTGVLPEEASAMMVVHSRVG